MPAPTVFQNTLTSHPTSDLVHLLTTGLTIRSPYKPGVGILLTRAVTVYSTT